jgi:hypothetical protein
MSSVFVFSKKYIYLVYFSMHKSANLTTGTSFCLTLDTVSLSPAHVTLYDRWNKTSEPQKRHMFVVIRSRGVERNREPHTQRKEEKRKYNKLAKQNKNKLKKKKETIDTRIDWLDLERSGDAHRRLSIISLGGHSNHI